MKHYYKRYKRDLLNELINLVAVVRVSGLMLPSLWYFRIKRQRFIIEATVPEK